jgi:hypothetical protein
MDATEIAVAIAGACLIAFVLWYFFGESDGPHASSESRVRSDEEKPEGKLSYPP